MRGPVPLQRGRPLRPAPPPPRCWEAHPMDSPKSATVMGGPVPL